MKKQEIEKDEIEWLELMIKKFPLVLDKGYYYGNLTKCIQERLQKLKKGDEK